MLLTIALGPIYLYEEILVNKKNSGVKKSDIKAERVKGLFVNAAKEIILIEGVEGITIRKVAEKIGYSYATIYSYFEDINDLLWQTREAMVIDIGTSINARMLANSVASDDIKKMLTVYVEYFFENPNIFKYLYIYKAVRPSELAVKAEGNIDFDLIWQGLLKPYADAGRIKEEQIKTVSNIIIYAVHGMLTVSFTDNWELTQNRVCEEIERMIDYLLKG